MDFLCNVNLKTDEEKYVCDAVSTEERLLFVIVGNLNLSARYSTPALAATDRRFLTIDLTTGKVEESIAYSEIGSLVSKRMYGNGLLRVKKKDGTVVNLFRFTFGVAPLCDSAISFFRELTGDGTVESAFSIMEGTYNKALSVCPNCGRVLSAPGVSCIACMNKGKLLSKLAKYMKPEVGWLILSVFLSVITTGLSLVPPKLTQRLVDHILPEKDRNGLWMIVFMLLTIYLVRYTVSAFRSYFLRAAGDRVVASIRKDVYEKAQHLPMTFYDKTTTGGVINRISNDTSTLQSYMLRITQEVFVQAFYATGIIVIMLVTNWKLTLFSLIPVPIVAIGARIFRKIIQPYYHRIWKRGMAVTSVLADTIPGIRVVKAFANEKNAVNIFSDCVEEWRKTDTNAGKILSVYPAAVNLLIACGTVVIWQMGGTMVMDGSAGITVGLLVSFISYASMFYEPVNFFANLSDSTQNAMAATERIMDILDAEPEHDFGKGNTGVNIGGRIEFKNVNFSFDRTKRTLRDINLTIEPGEIVGIVGTTGSGKSTLVNLLLRYYDHYDGEITVDGVDIRDIDMNYYRSNVGYVQQEPMMFHDTVYNNISYGDSSFTTDEVINAADVANAHQFIARQPDGYDTVLGERGVGLSGGERQRISIARAILRNPKMMVFDEATASVDSETERLIQDAIERLISGRTTIMIAHRLSTLSKADKIVVLENGRIIECGTPDELIAQKGKYYKLVQIQSMSNQIRKMEKEG